MLMRSLYLKRKKINPLSYYGLKTIIKRWISFPKLLVISINEWKLILRGAKIGELVVIEACEIKGSYSNLKVSDGSFIGNGCHLAIHDHLSIGKNVVINSGAKIFTASHDVNCPKWSLITAPVILEDYTWIASSAIVLPGSIIRKGAIIGAGAVVSGVVESNSIIIGNPGKVINNRHIEHFKYNPAHYSALVEAWLGKEA